MKIGITGQCGFIGTHLFNEIMIADGVEAIPFDDLFFLNTQQLNDFVKSCDVIVHLAAMNRHDDEQVIYDTNIALVNKLISALLETESRPHILFSSSSQEEQDNLYGRSKMEGRRLFEQWAQKVDARFTGLVVPNVFGPFGKPFYNSFVATFCHLLNLGEAPTVNVDSSVNLIYVGSLCQFIISRIKDTTGKISKVDVPFDFTKKVGEVLSDLEYYKSIYLDSGFIPKLKDMNEVNLFNTFTSYINFKERYPVALQKHSDDRGDFVEVIKLSDGGQVSFSTTKPGITRGNHYHTRKIERFAVIKGKARIELRKIGTDKKLTFELDGSQPSYVDMPIWYTHNITNIGDDELYTQFWINEWFDQSDTDTFFEIV